MKEIEENKILREVSKVLEEQTLKGLEKYGHTVNPREYDAEGWIDHLQQELVDSLVYSTIIKKHLGGKVVISKERVQELESILEQDHRQEVLEGLYEENKRYREAVLEIAKRWDEEHEDNPSEYQGGRLDGLDVALGIIEDALEELK